MLKLAVVGAQTLLGRELVKALEDREASVLPLSTGALSPEQEEGDLVVFAPEPALLEGLDLVILAADLEAPGLLEAFQGRILDLRETHETDAKLEPMPLTGSWPTDHRVLRGRPALEQVLALLPSLMKGIGELAGTHLRSVAWMGDRGIDGLMTQTLALLKGDEPEVEPLGYRAAFEVVPVAARGSLMEVRVPVFHGDLLILHLKAEEGLALETLPAPQGVKWMEQPPTSRDVAVSAELLAHVAPDAQGQQAILTLGFDPILWGVLRPVLRLLEL